MMQADLVDWLRSVDAVANLVGKNPANTPCIDWVTRQDNAPLPAIVMQTISTTENRDQDGLCEYEPSRIQFDIYAPSYAETRRIFTALRSILNEPQTHKSTRFEECFLDSDRDFPPSDIAGGERTFRLSADFRIWHRPVPQPIT